MTVRHCPRPAASLAIKRRTKVPPFFCGAIDERVVERGDGSAVSSGHRKIAAVRCPRERGQYAKR